MKNSFLLFFVVLFICSCSQVRVHLYAKYLSNAEIEEISNKLIEADFVVKPNHLKFPQSVTQSSLTYSPLINDRNAVNTIINTLHNVGWDIPHTSMLFIDNHWYSENSVALMILPANITPQMKTHTQDWVNIYTSDNCKLGLTINLNRTGQYQILSEPKLLLQNKHATGEWVIKNFPYLEVSPDNSDKIFYFELKQRKETDKISEIQISELVPMSNYSIFAGCTFVNGLRI